MNILQPGTEDREGGVRVVKEQVKQKGRQKERVLILTQYKLWDLQTNSRSGTMGTRPTERGMGGADLPAACSASVCDRQVSEHNNAAFSIAMLSGVSLGKLSQGEALTFHRLA